MTPRERRRAAVKEYSRLRPRTIYEEWVPTAGVKAQTYPANVFGVLTIDYGVRETLYNVASEATGAEQGFSDESGVLYLTPAPADTTAINVVWRAEHEPVPNVEDTEDTYPTIPLGDSVVVDQLDKALELEELAHELLDGPIKFSNGQKAVDRSGNPQALLGEAKAIRTRVYLQLSAPVADWA